MVANYSRHLYVDCETGWMNVAKMAREKQVIFYQDAAGKDPFNDWLRSLRNPRTRRRILNRLLRVEGGHYGDCRSLKDGVFELRLVFGPGYRVYFGEAGDTYSCDTVRRRQEQPNAGYCKDKSLLEGVFEP